HTRKRSTSPRTSGSTCARRPSIAAPSGQGTMASTKPAPRIVPDRQPRGAYPRGLVNGVVDGERARGSDPDLHGLPATVRVDRRRANVLPLSDATAQRTPAMQALS